VKKRKRRTKAEIEAASLPAPVKQHIEACQQRGSTHRSLIDELKDVQKDVLSRLHSLESRIEQAIRRGVKSRPWWNFWS